MLCSVESNCSPKSGGPDWVGDAHVVEVHVASLRRKLGDSAVAGRFIRTVRGVGYRMGDGQPRGASDER